MYNLKPSYTIVAKEENGILGWVLEDLPECEDDSMTVTQDGYIIAHDLLDHVTGFESMGLINDEIIAFGSAWFIRGEYDQIRRGTIHANETMIASDLSRHLMEILVHNSDIFNDVVLPVNDNCSIFDEVIEETREAFNSGLEYEVDNLVSSLEGATETLLLKFRHLLALGYNLAVSRYNDDWMTVNNLFFNIEAELNKHMQNIDYEGQILKLSIDQFGGVEVGEMYLEYEGYDEDENYFDEVA